MLDFYVVFDDKGTLREITKKFEKGSEAQILLDKLIMAHCIKRMPKVTGQFIEDSKELNKQFYGTGELVFPGPFAVRLNEGLTKDGRPFNFTTKFNPLAGSRWVERTWEDDGLLITSILQDRLDGGIF